MTDDELREAEMFGDGETDEVSMASYQRQQCQACRLIGRRPVGLAHTCGKSDTDGGDDE